MCIRDRISVTLTKMTTTFKILCISLQTLAVPSGPHSFAVLCRPLLLPQRSFAVFVMVLCGPLSGPLRFLQTLAVPRGPL